MKTAHPKKVGKEEAWSGSQRPKIGKVAKEKKKKSVGPYYH